MPLSGQTGIFRFPKAHFSTVRRGRERRRWAPPLVYSNHQDGQRVMQVHRVPSHTPNFLILGGAIIIPTSEALDLSNIFKIELTLVPTKWEGGFVYRDRDT